MPTASHPTGSAPTGSALYTEPPEPPPPPPITGDYNGFYWAWIDEPVAFDPLVHAVRDEDIVGVAFDQIENDFPSLKMVISYASANLLSVDKKRWGWLSFGKADGTLVPLICCWLVDWPTDMRGYMVEITLKAQPDDWYDQKVAIANTLKVLPKFDAAFIKPDRVDDPDVALEGYTLVWNIDPKTLLFSTTDLINGEDGNIIFDSGEQVAFDSVSRGLRNKPSRRARVNVEAFWDQYAKGTVNVKVPILEAAKASGTVGTGVVETYHGQGLADDWPREGDDIGSGWSVASASATFVDQEPFIVQLENIPINYDIRYYESAFGGDAEAKLLAEMARQGQPGSAEFWKWSLVPEYIARYEITRRRSEKLTFILEADIQSLSAEEGEDEIIEISFTGPNLAERVDAGNLMPIGDVRNRSYFPTTRGRKSVEYFLGKSRARFF